MDLHRPTVKVADMPQPRQSNSPMDAASWELAEHTGVAEEDGVHDGVLLPHLRFWRLDEMEQGWSYTTIRVPFDSIP